MNRLRLVFVLTAALVVSLFSSGLGMWAAPGTDPLRQTVPTRTPTSPPGPPPARTPTPGDRVEDTPTPSPPMATHTSTPQSAVTGAPTLEGSPTATLLPVGSPTAAPASHTPMAAWDFGDAPDPSYPSLIANDGARHSIVQFEWLGEGVDQEEDAREVDQDLHDDGVEIRELATCTHADLEVGISVLSRDDAQHPYDAEHLLYLNVLVDWDGDGSWSGRVSCPQGLVASEWAVRNLPMDVSSWPQGATFALVPLEFPVGPRAGQTWARFTLSYGEVISGDDWDGRGSFTFGETEDYLVTVSQPRTPTSAVPSPTSATRATLTPTGGAAGGLPMGIGPWQSVLCFSVGLLVGVGLVAVWVGRRRKDWRLFIGGLILIALLLAGGSLYYGAILIRWVGDVQRGSAAVPPTPHERLIPTVTETEAAPAESVGTAPEVLDTHTPELSVTPSSEVAEPGPQAPASTPQFVIATPAASLLSDRDRFGFGVAMGPIGRYTVDQLRAGWYVNWRTDLNPARPEGMEFVQMIRVRGSSFSPSGEELERIIQTNPGSLWLIGNEPDVVWQDNATPSEYAQVYHEAHSLLKSIDPTCKVAIAGVSQITPLRLQYLDMILDSYQHLHGEMIPVDVWNVHGFILGEERGSWGVDIPPGMSVDRGRLLGLDDHDNMDMFGEQILAFRRWMKDRGERNKPLIVSEYGILMPEDYGFPYERVREFMYATFDYFMRATDLSLGYPADGNRLVQRWAWYSASDTVYPTGNLFDPDTGLITPLGLAYGSYTSAH
ncbi:MAG: glycosyl hydrolase [Anaerolineae bacterium]